MEHTSTPKHGKRHENRLWSSTRRGNGPAKQVGGMNPDANIAVAAVCGSRVAIYEKAKRGRKLRCIEFFPTHGAAVLYAVEHDASERMFLTKNPTIVEA